MDQQRTGFIFSRWLYRIVRTFLGAVFLWSGTSKLFRPSVFATLIEAYGLVPDPLLMPVAISLATLETAAGAALMVDMRGSLSVIGALLVLFSLILSYGIRMGLDVDCGCFGPESLEAKAYHGLKAALYRDLAMMSGIAYMYLWRWKYHLYGPERENRTYLP